MGRGQGSGWKNMRFDDSRRHSLASKGVKTAQKIPRMQKSLMSYLGNTDDEVKTYLYATERPELAERSFELYKKERSGYNPFFYDDVKLYTKINQDSDVRILTWSVVKHIILDNKYLASFDGIRFKGINKVNPRTLKFFTNGQIIKGRLKPSEKDLEYIEKFNQKIMNLGYKI